jgi:cell division protein FtsI/penicillin-binding protein 2
MPADVMGYDLGGKTGTSFKVIAGNYDRQRRITWFFAGFPMNDAPRYTLLIIARRAARHCGHRRTSDGAVERGAHRGARYCGTGAHTRDGAHSKLSQPL